VARLPLEGLRVVDCIDERGELCGRLLSDLGADVLRVETPTGSPLRFQQPRTSDDSVGLSFVFRNAGKRGAKIDWSTSGGRERLLELLARADVWLEAYSPGRLDEVGLGPRSVRERFPRLIVCSITDFGQTGPYRSFRGGDMIGYAMGGMLYRAGAADRPPLVAPGTLAYDTAAVSAALAVCTAHLQQDRDGRGQWIDVSVQEAVANIADWSVPLFSALGFYQHREGAGNYPLYRCRDGWLRMIVFSARQWRTLWDWIGRPEDLADPDLEQYWARLVAKDRIDHHVSAFVATGDKLEAAREAQARGLAATPLLSPAEAIDNEHVRARGSLVSFDVGAGRPARVPSGFFHLDGHRIGPRGLAPTLDADESGFSGQKDTKLSAPPAVAAETADSPFGGLLVLDFGTGVAGTEVGRLLYDYGADVIKIESRTAPDFVRMAVPGAVNAPFASSNRGKRSLGVNLKSDAGRELVYELVARADVVIENSAAGVMDRLGLGYAELARRKPDILVFSTQLLGASGPWSRWIGYGPNAHAVSGLQYLWNDADRADSPAGSANIHPDHVVGRLGALALAACLRRRRRTGEGAYVQIAQFEVLLGLLGDLLAKESLEAGSVTPQGNERGLGAPWGVYPCAGEDEWCVINVASEDQWQSLCGAMGEPELASDSRFADAAARSRNGRDLDAYVARWTRGQEPFALMELLQNTGVPAGVVEHPPHQLADEHLRDRAFFVTLEQPSLGTIVLEGPCFRGDRLGPRPVAAAPQLGEHTRAICKELLGLSPSRIDALFSAGVLEEPDAPPA